MSGDAPVVINAGPLMVLAKLNLLHLLKELYGRVHFARSVYDEAVIEGMRQGYEDARTLFLFFGQMDWEPRNMGSIEIHPNLSQARLDRDERDTLALAVGMGSELVLVDEAEARRVARAHGLAVCGSLGILIEAHQRGLLGVDQLRFGVC